MKRLALACALLGMAAGEALAQKGGRSSGSHSSSHSSSHSGSSSHSRAPAGGAIGANGHYYKGGQFMPKGSSSPSGSHSSSIHSSPLKLSTSSHASGRSPSSGSGGYSASAATPALPPATAPMRSPDPAPNSLLEVPAARLEARAEPPTPKYTNESLARTKVRLAKSLVLTGKRAQARLYLNEAVELAAGTDAGDEAAYLLGQPEYADKVAPGSASVKDSEVQVTITHTPSNRGPSKLWHRLNCRLAAQGKDVTLEMAKRNGYQPCLECVGADAPK